MNSDYSSVLIIVAFVLYPFAVIGIAACVVSRSGRERFLMPAAKLFALAGCFPPTWFVATYGFGFLPPVTIIASAVFVFAAAATGGLFGAILDLFLPAAPSARKQPNETIAINYAVDENPYASPTSHI